MNSADIRIKQGFEVFSSFKEDLRPHWDELYQKGGNYNLSFEFCSDWMSFFAQGKKPYIVTFWENKELKLLAPFYIKGNKVSLIGTKPDVYDEFEILYQNTKHLEKLVEFLLENKLELNFKHLNTSSQFAKILINKLAGKGIHHTSNVTETKPFLKGEFSTESNVRSDIKRCCKNLQEMLNEQYSFEFSTQKTPEAIEEFVSFHINRWDGGMLVKKKNLANYIRHIIKNNPNLVLSKLQLTNNKDTAGYTLGFIDTNKKYWLSMVVYNQKYKKFAPGKVLLVELITTLFAQGIKDFDFGRGSENYKRNFANGEDILFCCSTSYTKKYYIKARNLLDKILKLIFGLY